jgi:acyl-CoA synthetase (AMP-forming)/AMP-acid ligase II
LAAPALPLVHGRSPILDFAVAACSLAEMWSFLGPNAAILDLTTDHRLDSAEVAAEVTSRAERLAALGVGPDTTLAIIGEGASFFCDLFAAWSLGAAGACLDPALTATELENVLEFLRPAAIATALDYSEGPAKKVRAEMRHDGSLDDPALILFTSGTTGVPKGVVLSFRAILARLSLNRIAIGDHCLERGLVTLPTHFGHGLIGNALTPLAAGGTIVLPERGISLAANLGRLVDQHAITFMSSVPAFWRLALKLSKRPEGSTLNRVHVGSAPLTAELWSTIVDWAGCEVVNCYGMTETANWFGGASSSDRFVDNAVGSAWGGRAGIICPDGGIAEEGEGEIAVLSPSVMSGYLNRPDETRAAFHAGWYRTGDFGRVHSDGSIVLTGRVKDEINRAGFKIQPAEIDRVVELHPAVAEACAFGIPDSVSGEVLGVAVRLVTQDAADEGALRSWCATRLRREAAPERWFLVTDIPRNERGKVNRVRVREIVTGIA